MLEARGVSFAYPGGRPVYEGLDLSVAPGERVALCAPSGFGKTTLCKMLAGYLEPSAGQVLADGAPLPRKGRSPVQMVWQSPEAAVDPRMRMAATLAEAGVGRAGARSFADAAYSDADRALMEELGIREEWLARFPHELSGGEVQRFCIARALGARPRYVVADEVSTMLDAVTQAQVWRALIREADARGLGVVLVTHSPALRGRVATRSVDLAAQRART